MARMETDFLIRPLGPLFFGQPRSFFAGEAHRSESQFPPPQSAFQGMVRSQLLRAAGVDFQKDKSRIAALVGGPDALPEGWQLQGPFPARVVEKKSGLKLEPWLPAPRYLLQDGSTLLLARPISAEGVLPMMTNLGRGAGAGSLPVGLPRRASVQGVAGGWLSAGLLRQVLMAKKQEWPGEKECRWSRPFPPFVHREGRPGLGLQRPDDEHPGVAAHGMLYFLGELRIEQRQNRPAGFYGRLEAPGMDAQIPANALENSLGMAGRKGVPAAFEPPPPLDEEWVEMLAGSHLPEEIEESQRFWLTVLTPVRPEKIWSPLRNGVLPEQVRLEVDAVLTGEPISVGGLRMVDRRSRANRRFLPAGTSWLIRLTGADPATRASALKRLNGGHPMGSPQEAAFGHGFTLAGVCKEDGA